MWTLYLYTFSVSAGLLLTGFAAFSDFKSLIIPNWVSLLILAIYPVAVLTSPELIEWWWSLAVFGVVLVIGFTLFIIGGLGGGDVKLISALSLWAGLDGIFGFLMVTVLMGGVLVPIFVIRGSLKEKDSEMSLIRKMRTQLRAKLQIPYGVAIAFGSLPVFYQYAKMTNLLG